jgi:hypothetical protein
MWMYYTSGGSCRLGAVSVARCMQGCGTVEIDMGMVPVVRSLSCRTMSIAVVEVCGHH